MDKKIDLVGLTSFNLVNENLNRIVRDSNRDMEKFQNAIYEQKQEEKRQKERDSRNIELTARKSEEISELLSSMNNTLDLLVNKIGSEVELTQSELGEMNKLLFEIKDIALSELVNREKESKMMGILKQGLSVGKQASMMLFLEYLKFKAQQYGFPIG